jgi:hypothetical protein
MDYVPAGVLRRFKGFVHRVGLRVEPSATHCPPSRRCPSCCSSVGILQRRLVRLTSSHMPTFSSINSLSVLLEPRASRRARGHPLPRYPHHRPQTAWPTAQNCRHSARTAFTPGYALHRTLNQNSTRPLDHCIRLSQHPQQHPICPYTLCRILCRPTPPTTIKMLSPPNSYNGSHSAHTIHKPSLLLTCAGPAPAFPFPL